MSARGHVRWFICGLLFFATTVNYVDRQVIGILKPTLERELHWSEANYGWVVFAFQCAYALMMPFAGRLIDRIGTRLGYALAVLVWSAASMFHSVARTTWQFAAARFALGIGESANFPAAIRTVADWFPRSERALATGIFNSGSNVGAIVAPLLVPVVALHLGWRVSFLVTGGLDLVWLAAWLIYFRAPGRHRGVSKAELEWIRSDAGEERAVRVPWMRLAGTRQAWAFIVGKFMTDPVWWFYLFWIPGFLHRAWGLDLTALGPPLVAIYVAADVGSIGGGWMGSAFASRKTAMFICACGPLPIIALLFVKTLWPAVALLGLAAAAHQGWSANLYTLVSDTFPRSAVASVVGIGGFAGAVGGMLTAPLVGYWLDYSHDWYRPLFVIAGVAYLAALGMIQLLVPRLERAAV
ncbi:MAG TPA: MFS transporter [Bryobacteraceae bacterium]|nr:MFS transporter [Bryobacteraceae bacterium]